MLRNTMLSTELIFKLFKFFHTTKIPKSKTPFKSSLLGSLISTESKLKESNFPF